jgi:hypothetical protein
VALQLPQAGGAFSAALHLPQAGAQA